MADRTIAGAVNWVRHSTSGSTGEPMTILRTPMEERLIHAYQLRAQWLHGIPFRARRAHVGMEYRPSLAHRTGLLPGIFIDATSTAASAILEELRSWRADSVELRPGVLESLVLAAEKAAEAEWPFRWIVCGGEVLFPDARARARKVFGCPVIERYGAHEVGSIAWRCGDCGGLHVNDDSVIVEIEKDGRPAEPGESGDVLVTGLLSFGMPILRFRLGDHARWAAPTDCRFRYRAIEAVEGRRLDNLTLPDGRQLPSYRLMQTLREVPGVLRFQVIQLSLSEIRVRYVLADAAPADPAEPLARRARSCLPAEMSVTVECVSEIPLGASGKHHYIRSMLTPRSSP